MKKTDPLFQEQLETIHAKLIEEFLAWNDIQRELKEKGYPHNYYDERELERERSVFLAVAERLVLEDIPCKSWKWFETPWAGIDGNTGMEARVIDFLIYDDDETVSGIFGFYVTRNRRFWYALPLAEILSKHGTITCEANCIQDALDTLNWLGNQPWVEEDDPHDS